MSQSVRGPEKTLVAGEDLSSKQFYIMQLDSSGDLEIAESATDFIVGVLQNKPKSGEHATYRFAGTTKVRCGGSISIGNLLTAASDGEAVVTTTNADIVIGRALEAGDDQDIIEVQLFIHKAWFA